MTSFVQRREREAERKKLILFPPHYSNNKKRRQTTSTRRQEAKSKFQSLQRIYAVLSDEGKRASYDRTGSLDAAEGLAGESFEELFSYFRDKFKEVTPADIDDYELQFRGSPEELGELFELYRRFRGGMEKVFEWLICSDPLRDSHRFAAAIRRGIEERALESYPAFASWCKAKVDGKPPPAEVRKSFLSRFLFSRGAREKGKRGRREGRNEKQKTLTFSLSRSLSLSLSLARYLST